MPYQQNKRSPLYAAILLALPVSGFAGGFGVTVQSATGGGNAATGHALAEDASAMFYNPALLSSMKGNQVNGGISILATDIEVTNMGSNLPAAAGSTPVIGSGSDEPGGASVTPSLYYKRDFHNMAFGLGINVPYGVSTSYDDDSFVRYEGTDSELAIININPALSWRINEKVDIGAGLNLQYGTATLAKSVDSVLLCGLLAGAGCNPVALAAAPSTAAKDDSVSIEATSLAYGLNIGAAFHPSSNTTISVGYRSSVKHEMEGDADFTTANTLTGFSSAAVGAATIAGAGFGDQDAETELEMPASLSLAFASKVSPRLAVHGDVTWTEWSSVPEIRITFPDTTASDSVTSLKWEDTVRVGVGATYQLSPKTKLRSGLAYDPTPTPGPNNRTPRAPSSDNIWLSFGASHDFNKHLTLDGSLALVHPNDSVIDYTAPGALDYLTRANVETSAISAALSVNYRF